MFIQGVNSGYKKITVTVSFWIFPAREECRPTCWNKEGLKRMRRLDFCLSQCFWRDKDTYIKLWERRNKNRVKVKNSDINVCVCREKKKKKKNSENKFPLIYARGVKSLSTAWHITAEGGSRSQKYALEDRALTYGIFLWVAYFDPEYVI